jgi:hypothetical protein
MILGFFRSSLGTPILLHKLKYISFRQLFLSSGTRIIPSVITIFLLNRLCSTLLLSCFRAYTHSYWCLCHLNVPVLSGSCSVGLFWFHNPVLVKTHALLLSSVYRIVHTMIHPQVNVRRRSCGVPTWNPSGI